MGEMVSGRWLKHIRTIFISIANGLVQRNQLNCHFTYEMVICQWTTIGGRGRSWFGWWILDAVSQNGRINMSFLSWLCVSDPLAFSHHSHSPVPWLNCWSLLNFRCVEFSFPFQWPMQLTVVECSTDVGLGHRYT